MSADDRSHLIDKRCAGSGSPDNVVLMDGNKLVAKRVMGRWLTPDERPLGVLPLEIGNQWL